MLKYVHVDKKTGRLVFRRAYPAALRPYIPGQPRELVRTLKSAKLDAVALALRYKSLVEFDRVVTMARKAAAGAYDFLGDAHIAYFAEAFHQLALEQDDEKRWSTDERALFADNTKALADAGVSFQSPFTGHEGGRFSEKAAETTDAMLAVYRHVAATGDVDGLMRIWRDEAEDLAAANGLRVDASTPQFAKLCQALNASAILACEAKLARLDGEVVPTPAPPLRPSAWAEPQQATATQKSTSLESIATRMIENPALGITDTTAETWRTALRYFREAFGPIAPRQIERGHATELRDLLHARPARPPKDERNLDLRTIFARYEGRKEVARLSGVTVRQHLRSLSTIWTRAQEEGRVPSALANPFKGVRINVEAPPENPQELDADELATMFNLPVFTQRDRPAGGRGEAAYWLPLLARYTGARPEELAQLMVSDVIKDQAGRLHIKITGEGEAHPAKGKRTLKTRKSRTGVRRFPVPAKLLELGFTDYLDWLNGRKERALFPLLTTKGSRGLHAGFSRWWAGYLRLNNAFPKGEGRRPWREFRQNWASAAIQAGLSQEERNYLMGHAIDPRTASGHYGNRDALGQAMLRVAFDEKAIKNVAPWTAPSVDDDTILQEQTARNGLMAMAAE